jgi:hypothetical protein
LKFDTVLLKYEFLTLLVVFLVCVDEMALSTGLQRLNVEYTPNLVESVSDVCRPQCIAFVLNIPALLAAHRSRGLDAGSVSGKRAARGTADGVALPWMNIEQP